MVNVMGVYIKGMDVEVARRICAYVGLTDIDESDFIAVPEPHGRLIDGDELKTAFPTCDNSTPVLVASVRATINHAPTIIEAKGE